MRATRAPPRKLTSEAPWTGTMVAINTIPTCARVLTRIAVAIVNQFFTENNNYNRMYSQIYSTLFLTHRL